MDDQPLTKATMQQAQVAATQQAPGNRADPTKHPNKPFRFMDLPPELRFDIYELVVKGLIATSKRTSPECGIVLRKGLRDALAMLHVSRKMRAEIIDDGKCARFVAQEEEDDSFYLLSYLQFDLGDEDLVDWNKPVFDSYKDFGFVQQLSEMLEMVKGNVEGVDRSAQ